MSLVSRAVDSLEVLESKFVHLPGGRDREGRPLIVVNVPSEIQSATKLTAILETALRYLINIFSDETKSNGFTILVDAQRDAWRVARGSIRQTSLTFGSKTPIFVIVLRSDGFWEKHVDNCTKSQKAGEPLFIPLNKLFSHIESSQLPPELGGSKFYNHSDWIQSRIQIEDYLKDVEEMEKNFFDLSNRLKFGPMEMRNGESENTLKNYNEINNELMTAARHILHSGRNFSMNINRDSSQDYLDTINRVKRLLNSIESKQVEVADALMELERHLGFIKEIKTLEEGVARVTNWILGPADGILNSGHRVGFDVASSEELRREHEELELKCRDTYGRYAELLHKIDSITSDLLPEDLKSQRDFMDFVCRSFASRLERRRNVLITSQRFFRLVSEYFDRTSEVFDKLVMGNKVYNFSQAGEKLSKLERNQSVLEAIEIELVKEGEKLSDVLSMPVKDALGRDIRVDYGEDIVNVRDILDATNARKNIFSDSVELQKLTLKQVALIHTYENDAEQAVQWIGDLFKVLVKNHVQIGCNVNEIQTQKNEHLSFQETAKGTYDYGCQLLNGARVLRISCRLTLDDNTNISSRLWQAWRQLKSVGQEQLTRLRVCAVFHRSVQGHCARLEDLIEAVVDLRKGFTESNLSLMGRNEMREVLTNREKLLLEVGRMVRLGRLLRTRLKEPLYPRGMSDDEALVGGGNLTAVEAISTRLAEVTRLAEKLDSHLCEAGAKSDDTGSQAPSTSSPVSTIQRDLESRNDVVDVDVARGIKKMFESSSDVTIPLEQSPKKETEVDIITEHRSKIENISTNNPSEDLVVDDYATATESSLTPAIQSGSASFTTASECGDAAWWDVDVPASDVENVEIPDLKSDELALAVLTEVEGDTDDTSRNKSDIIELQKRMKTAEGKGIGIPEIDRSNASSTVVKQTTQEKSGKVMKEVTETTTLRVSQSTHFGVTSYKLTSNTLHNDHEHTDIKEIHDLREMIESGLTSADCQPIIDLNSSEEKLGLPEFDALQKEVAKISNGFTNIPSRKDSSSQDSDLSQESVREHSRLLKFTRNKEKDNNFEDEADSSLKGDENFERSIEFLSPIYDETKDIINREFSNEESIVVAEKPQRSDRNDDRDDRQDDSSDQILPIDDSGIEMTPNSKNNSKDDDDELLERMKEVSRNSKTGNGEDNKSSNGLINHCLIAQRAVRSAARFDFMLGEIC